MNFPFKSKLDRHLKSDDHRMFAESLKTSLAIDDDIEYSFPTSTHVILLCNYVCILMVMIKSGLTQV